jgi:hypothetical protein
LLETPNDVANQQNCISIPSQSKLDKVSTSIEKPTNEKLDFGERGLTPLSDRAWNISVALYYKAGGKPWILGTAREGVCYVGLVFKRTPKSQDARTACCAAQMFLDDGDGVVFRSEFGPWFRPILGKCTLILKKQHLC